MMGLGHLRGPQDLPQRKELKEFPQRGIAFYSCEDFFISAKTMLLSSLRGPQDLPQRKE